MILRHYDIQNIKDRMQIQLDKIGIERETSFCKFTYLKFKKTLRKSQVLFGKR